MNYPDRRIELPPVDVPRCPINVAARRSGLSAHVIRAWERRYSAIVPGRTSKLRRLYSDWEIQRLVLLRQAVDLGHRIGEIARLPMEELRALVGRETVPGVEASPRIPLPRARLVEVAVEAVRTLEGATFQQSLLQATRSLQMPDLIDEFVRPLWADISRRHREGDLRLAHHRFACHQLLTFMGDLVSSSNVEPSSKVVVVASLSSDSESLGTMMLAVTASRAGWEPVVVGMGMSVDEIVYVVNQRNAHAVALSFAAAAPDAALEAELRRLRQQLGPEVPVYCSGAGAQRDPQALQQMSLTVAPSARDLAQELKAQLGG